PLLGLGNPDRRGGAGALQPDELPQRLGLAARQRGHRRRAQTVRARRGRAPAAHVARRGGPRVRGPAAARALLRLCTPARLLARPLSRRVPAAGVGRGQRLPPPRSGARPRARRCAAAHRLPSAAAAPVARVVRGPEFAARLRPRGFERAARKVRRLDRDPPQGRRRRDRGDAMRMALLSTAAVSVPPSGYGGTERVLAVLADGLVAAGHDVTLFATGDSTTRAKLRALYPGPVWPIDQLSELNHAAWAVAEIGRTGGFDVVHANQPHALPLLRFLRVPCVYT